MSLTSFKVQNQKSVRLASADSVPRVMIIAGPNGAGKSTLLYGIKQGACVLSGNTKVLYQGPHRVLRRTTVSRRWLTGATKWFADLLMGGEVSGFEGLNFPNASRTPDNVDEAGSTIKHTLGKIENRRQSVHTELIDRRRTEGAPLDIAALPDVYEPLRDLTKHLLPHLSFNRVDFKNDDNIRCLWTRKDVSQTLDIDIDDLSSGEKSIIVLFLPLIEGQIRDRLQLLEAMASPQEGKVANPEDRVFLVDEPEQHLHPDLQAKLLGYIRSVGQGSNTQFVVTTHSPTILDQATDEELYVLTAPAADGADNQLKRVASSLERLEALKQLAGSAYFLTTGRVLVCIEGGTSPPDEVSDLRLLEIIYPRATAFTLVPSGGKGNVITTVTRLRENVPEGIFRIRVRGLVDADQSAGDVPGIFALPVCMIENLLLQPEAIHAYCASIGVETLPTPAAVNTELRAILQTLREEEIGRRVARAIRPYTVRIRGASPDLLKQAHAKELAVVREMLPNDEALKALVQKATDDVDRLLADDKARDAFHGKTVVKRLYQKHIAPKAVSYSDACLGIAKAVAVTGTITIRLEALFNKLAE